MARAFLPEDGRYVALLDETERFMIHGLMQQTRIVLSPEVESTGDAFADLVASMGVSVAGEDQELAIGGHVPNLRQRQSQCCCARWRAS